MTNRHPSPPSTDPEAWKNLHRSPDGALQVSVEWVASHIDDVRLIDVRGPEEFTGPLGHIDGAELVPLPTLADAATHWNRSAPIVTICRSGGRSNRAAVQLERLGFETVASMTGGMGAWAASST